MRGMTVRRALGAGVVLGAGALGLGACTALLGDDFDLAAGGAGGATGSTTGSGGGGGGGAGGTGGAGGQAAPVPLVCTWDLPTHYEVESLRGSPGEYWSSDVHLLTREGDGARAFVLRSGPNGSVLETHGLGTGPTSGMTSIPAADLFGAVRFGPSYTAALFLDASNGPVFKLWVVEDADFSGSSGVAYTITTDPAVAFPDLAPLGQFQAAFTVVSGVTPLAIDVVFAYPTTAGDYVERYGRFQQGDNPMAPVRISPTNVALGSDEVTPRVVVDAVGSSYAFMGDLGSLLGTREYQLNETVVGPQTPRVVGTTDLRMLAGLGRQTNALLTMASFSGQGIRMWLGSVPNGALATFDPATDLHDAGLYPTFDDLPVAEGVPRWLGSTFALVGTRLSDPLAMRYWFTTALGQPRGEGSLPFTASVLGVRDGIARVGVERRDPAFDTIGGRLHVLWSEHQTEASPGYEVLYYDLLSCLP